jgi:DNA-binding NarL/FixJ family response regulator
MSTAQQRSVLHKIAARRSRIGYTATSPAWDTFMTGRAPAATDRAPGLETRRRMSARAQPPILTQRELEVLHLVARGETDQGIAQRLNVSRRTISCHVSNILAKLDVRSRTAAAMTAARIGLLHSRA